MHHLSPYAGQYALVLLVSILGGAVFLSIGQALVGLVRSADSVNAAGRVLVAVLILLGTLGQSGPLGAPGSHRALVPVGIAMTLFAGVLNVASWYSRDTISLLVAAATSWCSRGSASAGSSGTPADAARRSQTLGVPVRILKICEIAYLQHAKC